MAIASLAMSFLAFIFPIGIASVVMGHISRKKIAESGGRFKGTGLAFAGLIISYLQLAFVALIFLIAFSVGRRLSHELDRDPYVRAALTERMLHGDPDHPSAAVMAQNVPNLMDSFHLIVAHQEEYRTKNNGNYACHLAYLEPESRDDELAVHIRNSHYGFRVECRGPLNDSGNVYQYTAVAYPITDANPPNPARYCMDQTKVIRRYSDEKSLETAMQSGPQPCPSDGEPVE
jgi:hypothetical protein